MASFNPDGSIQTSDGRTVYADDPVTVGEFGELAKLLGPKGGAAGGWPFVSGGGGGGNGNALSPAVVGNGAQGSQGSQGAQGPGIGAQGAQGADGAQGSAGPQGSQGVAGSGAQGAQGPSGPQGSAGAQGSQGTIGAQGATGTGAQGSQGSAGAQGTAGAQGAQGSGVQGAQGAAGTTGAQGSQGTAGAQGAQGSGAQGAQGTAGGTGAQGAQGSGAQGAQGADGAQGAQGSQGDATGSGWTDDGVVVRLTTDTDAVSIGTATELAKLAVVGDDPAQTVCILRKTATGAPDFLRCQENAGGAKVVINFSGEYQSFSAPGDAQPNFQIGGANAVLLMGAGGASAPDVNISRFAAAEVTASNNGGGGLTFRPATDDTGNLGTNTFRWSLVRATTITSGDLNLFDEERGAMWTLREEPDYIMAINRKTGKKYRLPLVEIP